MNPPGIFAQCDDIVITMHAINQGADQQLLQKFQKSFSSHPHFSSNSSSFIIKHYAGDVEYNIDAFCEKNRDVLFQDLIDLMNSSSELVFFSFIIKTCFVSNLNLSKFNRDSVNL